MSPLAWWSCPLLVAGHQVLRVHCRFHVAIESKISLVADYLTNAMGCTHPHEQTLRVWLTLILLWPSSVFNAASQRLALIVALE